MQAKNFDYPSTDRTGVLIASVLLAFALARLIETPRLILTLDLPGFYFAFPLTLGSVMTLFAAGLTAAGMDWLIRDHPSFAKKSTRENIMLPTVTTFVLGASLSILFESPTWWVGFLFGAILLGIVFTTEYITINPASPAYAFARAALTAFAYALFLILITSLRYSGIRLFLLVPAVFLVAGLISLRILHLDGADRWDFPWAIGIGIVCAQIGAGLHYWTLSPVQFGLALTGPLYALTMLSVNLAEDIPLRRAITLPIIILVLSWLTAVFV
ncbi:MAG: hypothetical protein JNK81_15260 [Anaerolineales bacterium]|nr:hypothetical protein [Anaerolineales bacterium]